MCKARTWTNRRKHSYFYFQRPESISLLSNPLTAAIYLYILYVENEHVDCIVHEVNKVLYTCWLGKCHNESEYWTHAWAIHSVRWVLVSHSLARDTKNIHNSMVMLILTRYLVSPEIGLHHLHSEWYVDLILLIHWDRIIEINKMIKQVVRLRIVDRFWLMFSWKYRIDVLIYQQFSGSIGSYELLILTNPIM